MTDSNDMAELETLLSAWDEANTQAEHWKVKELELRTRIFGSQFTNPVPGMNKKKITRGMALIGEYRLNYKVDKALLTELLKEPITAGVFDEILTYRPEVSGSKFRKLDDDRKRLVAPAITETPGTPGIEIKPQSKVRW